VETRNGASKTMNEIGNKNRLKEQFISSQIFHRTLGVRVRKITVGEQFEPQIIEPFDLVTQELYRLLTATIPIRTYNKSQQNQVFFEESK
jgi:hypothetical protein